MGFLEPAWLLLALGAAPLVWIGLRWFHSMTRVRAWSAVLLRTALVLLLAGMLANAVANRSTKRLAVVIVVDVSESVRRLADFGVDGAGARLTAAEALKGWIDGAVRDIRPDDLAGVVVFDGTATALAAPRRLKGEDGFGDISLDLPGVEGTNIEDAIRFAGALFPPDAARRLVLISDGNETAGDAIAAALESASGAGSASAPIDVVAVTYAAPNEIIVETVDAPPQAATDSAITVRVGVRSTSAAAGTLRLLDGSRPIDINGSAAGTGLRVTLEPGLNAFNFPVRLSEDVENQKTHRFRVVFEPDRAESDTIASNNSGQSFTVTPGKGKILVVDGVSDGDPAGPGAMLGRLLTEGGLEVRTVPPAELPTDILSLEAYDLVVLQNVAAEEVPRESHLLLAMYVNDMGGGLVMTGGRDSFAPGAWKQTPVEDLLPVLLDIPDDMVVPAAAVMFVLDSSGSMAFPVMGGRRSQQEIANEGAALAISTLDERDLVGVLAFDSSYDSVVPLGPNRDPAGAMDRVRGIGSGGGTNMYPPLAHAIQLLAGTKADVKHIILLTDGQSMGDASQGDQLAAMAQAGDISISTIAVGDGADTTTLERIALLGGGRFYPVNDPNQLPRIFLKDIRVIQKERVRETPFLPVLRATGSPLMAGIAAPLPSLNGQVLTDQRRERGVLTPILAPDGLPVLAHWNVGRGQVAAWTSDVHHWSRPWFDWPGHRQMWLQIARTISRPTGAGRSETTTEIAGDRLRVRVEVFDDDGRPMDLLTVPATVIAPDLTTRRITLSATGPGMYEAEVGAEQGGQYFVLATPQQGERAIASILSGATRAMSPEFRTLESDAAVLRRIAEATGGRVLSLGAPEESDLFDRSGVAPSIASDPLWRTLMVWALVALLLDVATRRIAWDRLGAREALADIRRLRSDRLAARAAGASATLEGLRAKRGRGGTSTAGQAGRGAQTEVGGTGGQAGLGAKADLSGAGGNVVRGIPGVAREERGESREPGAGAEEAAGGAAGLLAAKRRARARMESDARDGGGKAAGGG